MTLDLKDPQYPEHDLGSLELAVTLSPKEGDVRDAVRTPHEVVCSFISLSSCTHHISSSSWGLILLVISEVSQQRQD